MPSYTNVTNKLSRQLTDKHKGRLRIFMLDQIDKFGHVTGWARSTIGMYLLGNSRLYQSIVKGTLSLRNADILLARMQEAIEYQQKNGKWPDAQS